MAWIPKNKKTGVIYPAVDDAGKAALENDHATKGKYTFSKTDQQPEKATPAKASKEPVGAKKIPAPTDLGTDPNPAETE